MLVHAFDIEVSHRCIGPRRLMSIGSCCVEVLRGRREVVNRFFVTVDWGGPPDFDADTRSLGPAPARPAAQHEQRLAEDGRRRLVAHPAQPPAARSRRMRLVTVTDNAHFDVGWLDWFISTYSAAGLPLQHAQGSGGAPGLVCGHRGADGVCATWASSYVRDVHGFVPHDHHPLHDAINTAERYIWYLGSVGGSDDPAQHILGILVGQTMGISVRPKRRRLELSSLTLSRSLTNLCATVAAPRRRGNPRAKVVLNSARCPKGEAG